MYRASVLGETGRLSSPGAGAGGSRAWGRGVLEDAKGSYEHLSCVAAQITDVRISSPALYICLVHRSLGLASLDSLALNDTRRSQGLD